MSRSIEDQYADEIINSCEPIWKKAKKFWHAKVNLRMYQLQERMHAAYNMIVVHQWENESKLTKLNSIPSSVAIHQHALKMAVTTGQNLIAYFELYDYKHCDTTMPVSASYPHTVALARRRPLNSCIEPRLGILLLHRSGMHSVNMEKTSHKN